MIGKTILHYHILEEVGRGGMGIVYKAEDTRLDRVVAVKFLSTHLSANEENKTRFVQEAKSTAALNHPNILSVFDIGEADGVMYFVMEYVEGKTLKRHISGLKSGESIPVSQAIEWTSHIARGLKAAHAREVVHRDIKSENIMMSKDGHLKIMDFGIAKLKGGTGLTKTGYSMGTISYMSPEQAQGIPADQRSDLWSLGVVFYEMLTGELPFRAEHEAALSYLILNDQPLVPSALDLKIPHQVDMVVNKMMEKDRNKRYQNAEELLEALVHLRSDVASVGQGSKTKVIAVLPFDNISPEKESEYFSDGLMGELIANLARLKEMKVVSRTTSMQYKGTKKDIKTIGRELGARYILEGNVRKFQDNLRITAQLIDVETDTQLWAETYKGTLADVFDIQEQVSKQIVDALMVKLSPTEKVVLEKRATLNAEAFDCYLRARDFLFRRSKNSVQFAIQLFEKAIELDARYAGAYAGLGESYATFYQNFESKSIWLDKAIDSSLKALVYDSSLSEAYAALALAYFYKKSNDEAFTAGQRAIELDPNNFIGYWMLGRIYHSTDRDRDAIELFRKVIALNPDFYTAYMDLRLVYERLGMKEERDKTLITSLNVYERYISQHPDDARAHMFYALDLALSGSTEQAKSEALKAIELNPTDPLMLYNTACFYSQVRETRLAMQSMKSALTAGYADYEWMKRDSDLDNLRNEPDFVEIMKGK